MASTRKVGVRRMHGWWRIGSGRWGLRERAMTALAFIVICAVLAVAGQGLASGAGGEVMRVRFGGDGERTRVVVDLPVAVRGQVMADGGQGRVAVGLSGVSAGQDKQGAGSGLVRDWRVQNAAGAARIDLNLARSAEIERRFLLPPGDGVSHYRYVIDLKARGSGPVAAPAGPTPRAAAPAPRRAERPLIIIDPGHGGRDPGALGAHVRESAVTLAAAQQLKAELERTGRYRVRLTRESDVYVAHARRVAIARDASADLFISLHADAGQDASVRGASVYTLSEQGAGRAVREFTRNENWHRELRLPGRDPSVDRILLDMTQRANRNRSAQFARVLLGHLEDAGHPMLRRSHRDAGLAVLLAPDVPAVLLEMGFITNAEDEGLLSDARRRQRLMRAVASGIDLYFRDPGAGMMIAATATASAAAGRP